MGNIKNGKKYTLFNEALHTFPVVVSIPHSGTFISESVSTQFINPVPPLSNVDWYLDKLYDFLSQMGVTCLVANNNRYVIDLNRDISKNLVGSYANHAVYTHTTFDKPLYDVVPDIDEIHRRIENYYTPYHQKLQTLSDEKCQHHRKKLFCNSRNILKKIILRLI